MQRYDCVKEILINITRPSSNIYDILLELIEEYKQGNSKMHMEEKIIKIIKDNIEIIEFDIADILNPKYHNCNTCRWFLDE